MNVGQPGGRSVPTTPARAVASRRDFATGERAAPLTTYVASHYNHGYRIHNGLCYEACDVLSTLGAGTVVAPHADRQNFAWRVTHKTVRALTSLRLSPATPQLLPEKRDLFFYVAMRPDNLLMLSAMPNWRESARKAGVFLFETWSLQAERYKKYLRLLDDFDRVFVFNPNSVASVQRFTSTPVTYLPAGIDCLSATPFPSPAPRPIDVYCMGRIDEPVHEELLRMTQRDELFYLWDRGAVPVSHGYPQARLRTRHLIRRSRFFTSFNFRLGKKGLESGGEEAIPARVFEASAGGAVMIGSAPNLPEFETLFDWDDAFVTMPDDAADVPEFYRSLDLEKDRYRRAGIRSAAQSLRRHDWVYRWETVLEQMDLPIPPAVRERKARLAALADIAESEPTLPSKTFLQKTG